MAEQEAAVIPVVAPVVGAEKPEGEITAVDPNKTYSQEEVDRITNKIRKNERYRTRKEVEAYYQGRESVATPAKEVEQPKADQGPTRDQFGSYEEFLEAKADFTGRRAAREEGWPRTNRKTAGRG